MGGRAGPPPRGPGRRGPPPRPRFRIVRDAWRGHARGNRGLRIDWIVETEGERGVMAFDTLREAREWFDACVKEDAALSALPA